MAILRIECAVFDPVKITTATTTPNFAIDTWHEYGLISRSLYERLPGLEASGTGRVYLSGSMHIERPRVRVGIQIGAIRAVPVPLHLVDDGPSPLLLGSQFITQLFRLGLGAGSEGESTFTLEPPEKYDEDSLGVRLVPSDEKSVDALQLEKFLRGVRAVHNVGVLATTGLHQHADWPHADPSAKRNSVKATIRSDDHLTDANTLHLSWVDHGSVWLSLKSGAKAAFSWVSQLFQKSMDARLRATIANAASAEEDAAVRAMTREEIAAAKSWEQRRISAENIRRAREEWRKTIVGEIDFRSKLAHRIKDDEVRTEAERHLDYALQDLVRSDFLPIVEHVPRGYSEWRDPLPTRDEPDTPDPDLNNRRLPRRRQ